jgi:hypothetical protein
MKKSASIAKDLLKLAIQMRKGVQLETKDCYQQWRSMEAFVNHSTSESMQNRRKVPRMALPSTYVTEFPSLFESSTKMAKKTYDVTHHRYDPHLCACLLYNDNYQEANVGVYEPRDCIWLDANHPSGLHPEHLVRYWQGEGTEPRVIKGVGVKSTRSTSSSSSSASSSSVSSSAIHLEYPDEWAVLYFRQHLVAAHYDADIREVTVYNTATINFLNGIKDEKEKKKRKHTDLLRLYVSQWEKLSSMLWPESNRVDVIHLGVQGANDCGEFLTDFERYYYYF